MTLKMAFNGLRELYEKASYNIIKNMPLLHSNKPINDISISDSFRLIRSGYKEALNQRIVDNGTKELWEKLGIDSKHPESITNMQRAKSLFYHRDGNLALGRIAGVGFGGAGIASGAYSMVANGSPVRDSNGDFDVPGIPLI